MRALVVSSSILLATLGSAAAQSFPCGAARLAAEIAICDSPYLSSLDEEMSSLYFSLPRSVRNSAAVRSERASFLRRRNRCQYNEGCIASAYNGFIGYLSNY